MKKLFVCLILIAAISTIVYSHCHDTADCEKVVEKLVWLYWDKPNGNTAKYYTNPNHPGKPSLTGSVNAAASKWRNIEFQNETIPFNPVHKGETTQFEADDFDGLNVWDWKGIRDENGDPSNTLAYTQHWTYTDSDEIEEADVVFNYYRPLQTHAKCKMNEYCLLATAVHEMGHFAGLDHVDNTDGCSGHHVNYTMWYDQSKGSHSLEELKCEDKFALHHTYLVAHPDAD